ncbi:MAG: GNAT family N-acetyltransferase [Solirubrobacteraceae bacterium]|nr:MAG: hypothetical protein DLM63_08575 [Solirubrobacterales bacterium]
MAEVTARVWRAEVDEAQTVAHLMIEFRNFLGESWPSDNAMLAAVERLIEQRDTEYLLGSVHDDAPPAGVCQLRFRGSVWTAADDCCLEDLYVRDGARGQGLGGELVAAALERARERGCRRIELDVNEGNSAAVALYEAFGFSCTPARFDGRDLLMRLRLREHAQG